MREKQIEELAQVIAYSCIDLVESSCGEGECCVSCLATKLHKEGVTIQKWIPVTERLPNWRDGKVLVFTKYGFSICERTVNNRWQGQHANWITHWAYLPQPPKGE